MKATPEQSTAVFTHDRSLVVEAGAGTGKTWVLVQRFMSLLEAHPDWPLESIVAITFTEKATREMRNRVRTEIESRARAAPAGSPWHERRRGLERLRVSTIHGLCARILRENAIGAGVDPRFTVLDEKDTDLLKQDALVATLDQLAHEDAPCLRLLDDLRAIDVRDELASLLNRRGSVHGLFDEMQPPSELLQRWRAGVESMRAGVWQDLRRSLPELDEAMATLVDMPIADPSDRLAAAVASAQEGIAAIARGDYAAAIAAFTRINRQGGRGTAWGGAEAVKDLRRLLEAPQKAGKAMDAARCGEDVGPDDERAAEALQLWRDLWNRLEATYSGLKDERQALDFDDLELLTRRLLRDRNGDERLASYLAGINHLMVDEFQDTNQAQRDIVYTLADPRTPGKLFVVGDAKQSIYRFRQAQVSVFNRTAREVQAITGHPPVQLDTSFRTHRALVAAQNRVFDTEFAPLGDDYADYEARPGPLRAGREHRGDTPCVELLLLPRQDNDGETVNVEAARQFEAQLLADRLLALHESRYPVWDRHAGRERPFVFSDAAVLFRATTQVPLYEEQFQAAGLPYLTVAGRGYFDRPEVTDLIALLACLHNPADDLSLAVVLRSPLFSLSDETLVWLRGTGHPPVPFRQALADPPVTRQPERVSVAARTLSELWAHAGHVSVSQLLHLALDRTGYEAALALADAAERGGGRLRGNLHKFLALAHDRGRAGLPTFLRLVQNLRQREAREGEAMAAPPDAGAVQLMSVHAAKGLEFPVVAVADLGRAERGPARDARVLGDPEFGIVCRQRDEDGNWQEPMGYVWATWLQRRMEQAESKRLLYVACTRAADLLLLSGQPANDHCWLAALMNAWSVDRDGQEEQTLAEEGYKLLVRRPAYALTDRRPRPPEVTVSPGLDDVPALASTVPVTPEPRVVAVTRLQRLLSDDDTLPHLRPPVPTSGTPGERAPGAVLGRMVHALLADWDSITLPEPARVARLRQVGRRHNLHGAALADAMAQARYMLSALRRAEVFRAIDAATERQAEVPFTLRLDDFVLHGTIDLLYRDAAGEWHVLDWKTEWLPDSDSETPSPEHLTQLAVYAHAVRAAIGALPTTEVCHLRPRCRLQRYPRSAIEAEWQRLLALAIHEDPEMRRDARLTLAPPRP